jgi:hypothetical protein
VNSPDQEIFQNQDIENLHFWPLLLFLLLVLSWPLLLLVVVQL